MKRHIPLLFSFAAAVFACASAHDDTPGPGGSDSTLADAGANGSSSDRRAEVEGPIVKKEFPLATPALGGYTLVDAFPGVVFDIPAAIAWPKSGMHPFVLERTGQIRTIENGQRRDLLDFGSKVHVASEGGALGIALHPQFGNGTSGNQYVYVWYNACDVPGCSSPYAQRLERYTWDGASKTFLPGSVLTMIEEPEHETVHNAGKMLFGSDGFLYFGNGDDIQSANHQTITNMLFAGIFRIDVDMNPSKSHAPPAHTPAFTRQGYFIPNDNPFIGAVVNGLEEFYALGFRNPFSFSFDRKTGDMWMGDVGDSFREEVNQVVKGGNYQWPIKEAELDNASIGTTVGVSTAPKYFYTHAEMGDLASIFGGIVYRGPTLPELDGKYLFTDWPSNRIWALDLGTMTRTTLVDNQYKMQPMGIGEDNDGEFYILQFGPDAGGQVKRIARDTSADAIPKRLRETTLFDDVPSLKPAADLIAYDVASPLWSDGAEKQRWIRLPEGQKPTTNPDGSVKLPTGTVFVKQFDMPAGMNVAGRTRHLETRVMVVGSATTYGYSFRWKPDGSDATIVTDGADETLTDSATGKSQNWHFPSFGQCWECHRNGYGDLANTQRNDKYRILGFTPQQLGGQHVEGVTDVPALPKPSDTSRAIDERAFSYLAANCSPCHHENASYTGDGQTWIATYGAGSIAQRGMDQPANNYPMTVRLGIPNGKLVAPGDPSHSVLLGRIKTNDPDLRMPPLARNVVDEAGAAVIEAWINSLSP